MRSILRPIFGSARTAGALTFLPPALLDALRPLIVAAVKVRSLRTQLTAAPLCSVAMHGV